MVWTESMLRKDGVVGGEDGAEGLGINVRVVDSAGDNLV